MPKEWFVRVMGSELGPLDSSELRSMVHSGKVSVDDHARKGTGGSWVAISSLDGLLAEPDSPERQRANDVEAMALGVLGGSSKSSAVTTNSTASNSTTKTCPYCREPIATDARKCKHCGEYLDNRLRKLSTVAATPKPSAKSRSITMALCVFAPLGAHRLYVGKVASAIVMFGLSVTVAGLFVTVPWAFYDLWTIIQGDFTDADGAALQ